MFRYIINILQVLISPARGWDDIARRGQTPEHTASSGYYPLIAITAASGFLQLYYSHTPFKLLLPNLIESAAVTFTVFFLSRFISDAIWSSTFSRLTTKKSYDENRCGNFILYSLGLLAITRLIANCLPMTLSLIEFLPLVVLVEMWMGYRYVDVDKTNLVGFFVYSTITILLPPYLLSILFSTLLSL
ncbi:MAG: hypothetical protein K2M98_06645 [Muribaculum sp.]|nr:hypothetical protein [Muribaculum sp.]